MPASTPSTPTASRDPVGWGFVGAGPADEEVAGIVELLRAQFGDDRLWTVHAPPPNRLQDPRVEVPDGLAEVLSTGHETRLLHALGRSFLDMVALRETGVSVGPDLVARPRTPEEVGAVLDWCADAGVACIPVGGATSVVGGVTAAAVDGPVVALSLRAMDRVVQVDRTSRAALVEAGASGPVLEEQVRAHDLTMRFYPQSFELSTLGGWIATRAGGHYATRLTHIDDLVESVEAITPAGRWASRRLPGSGAGPSPDRLLLGSEGRLGVITRAWVRLQGRPVFKGGFSATFDSFETALDALRPLVQSGLDPANCRVLDPVEAMLAGAGDGSAAVMVVGAESPAVAVDGDLREMAELLADHGATVSPDQQGVSAGGHGSEGVSPDQQGVSAGGHGSAAEAWRRTFLRGPYLRDVLIDHGMITETFETAATWDRLAELVDRVTTATTDAVTQVCGGGIVTCRITHAYPDGAAPYFTVIAPGRAGSRPSQWQQIKVAASESILAAGGTITHHHAVGRDHRRWYDRQRPDVFAAALRGAAKEVDPRAILNPGVLFD